MKNFITLAILMAIPFTAIAQENTFEEDVNKLVKMTVNTGSKATMRMAIGFKNTAEEKEDLLKQYDAAVYSFLDEIGQFYLTEFTHDDIKQILAFYETPTGRKLLADKKTLVENDMPPFEEWKDKISEIKKSLKKGENESETEE